MTHPGSRQRRPPGYPRTALLRTAALAAFLALGAATAAAAVEWQVVAEAEVAPGLLHRELRGGVPAFGTRHRVVAGSFDSQREADATLARLEAAGLAAIPESDGARYRLTVGELADEATAAAVAERLRALGIAEAPRAEPYGHDLTSPTGPWTAHVLLADPRRVRLEVAHATDAAIGVETTRELAVRRGAIAAVNGGYYRMEGPLRGDSQGTLKIDGALLSEPDRGRGAVGLRGDGGSGGLAFGRLGFAAELRPAGAPAIPVTGVNRLRGDDDVVVYTPELHRTTLTQPGGVEVVVAGGRVAAVHTPAGSSAIPCDGFVLSFGPQAAAAAAGLQPGTAVTFDAKLLPLAGDAAAAWDEAGSVLGGGPLLLWDGERRLDLPAESMARVFGLARHPRTAIATRGDGTVLLVTVDGRDPDRSVGMSLVELTDLLLELGAVAALNLDGGGSTTMVVAGQVRNRPSDARGERENADAILLFPRAAAAATPRPAAD